MSSIEFLNKRWRNVLLLFIVFLFIVFVQDVVREVYVSSQETTLIRDELNRDIKNEVEANVQSIYEGINLIIDRLDQDLIKHSEDTLAGLLFATTNVVSMNPTYTDEEIKSTLSELTHEYSIADEMHDYYLYDTSGVLFYNGETASYNEVDSIHNTDYLNNLYMQEFVNEIALQDSAIITFYEMIDEELTHLVLFGRKVTGTSYVVANVVNMHVFSENSKNKLIHDMNRRFEDSENTTFVLAKDGEILYHPYQPLIGATVSNSEEPLTTVLTALSNYASQNGEGYIEYEFYGNSIDGEVESKIAYIKSIEEWDIIVGATVTENKYDEVISNYLQENLKLVLIIKLPSYIMMAILSVMTFIYLKSTITKSESIMEKEELLYRRFSDLTSEIILITDKQGEIIFSNNLGKKIIYGQREDIKTVSFDQILVEEEGYYILYGYTEDYYVKFITESIDYNGIDGELYIITDVTENIKTERKLEALSLVDELTKLGNRRMMVKDNNDIVFPYVKAGNEAFLVLVDLDDFKVANDKYGHSYGDTVLKNIASVFTKNKDENILIYRVGGDEFALIFMKYSQNEVVEKLKNMQKEVETFNYEKNINISFSAGVTGIKLNDQNRRFSDYFDKADKLLYKSKKQGKHKINV